MENHTEIREVWFGISLIAACFPLGCIMSNIK